LREKIAGSQIIKKLPFWWDKSFWTCCE